MDNSTTQLIAFIMRAKRNTYAAGGPEVTPSRPSSKDLPYREGRYHYIDTYLGSFNFIGEEAVWFNNEPVWGMNYYGRTLVPEIPDGFSECLKTALMNITAEAPYRGPASFQSGLFEYHCQWQGSIDSFIGSEEILFDHEKMYELDFHGGILR